MGFYIIKIINILIKISILCNPDHENNVSNVKQEKPDMITYFISLNVSLEMNSKQINDLFFVCTFAMFRVTIASVGQNLHIAVCIYDDVTLYSCADIYFIHALTKRLSIEIIETHILYFSYRHSSHGIPTIVL